MYKSVDSKDRKDWIVVDLDKKVVIKKVQWADDEKGEYEILINSKYADTDVDYKEIKKGNIKLIKIDWKYWGENNFNYKK